MCTLFWRSLVFATLLCYPGFFQQTQPMNLRTLAHRSLQDPVYQKLLTVLSLSTSHQLSHES